MGEILKFLIILGMIIFERIELLISFELESLFFVISVVVFYVCSLEDINFLSIRFALFMNSVNSSVGAYEVLYWSFSNRYKPLSDLTLESTTYSQFMNAALLCRLGQDEIMTISLDLPCSLCPVNAVHIFTGKRSMW